MQAMQSEFARAAARRSQHDQVTVRPLTALDRPLWTMLWQGYLTFYETELPPVQFDLTFQRLLDPQEPMFGALAENEGQVLGLVHFIFHRSCWSRVGDCYLQDLFTAKESRGQGIGRALIQHVAQVASEVGARKVHWLTHETNATARVLYDSAAARSGFIQYTVPLAGKA